MTEWKEVSEREATGEIAEIFRDIRRTLRVPLVNLLYRVWASEKGLLPLLWNVSRPNLQTIDFEGKADGLRSEAIENLAYDVSVPDQASRLAGLKLGAPDIARLRSELNVFHYVNFKLLLHCAMLKRALGFLGCRGTGQPLGFIEPGIPAEAPHQIELVDEQPSDPELKALFEDIRQKLKLNRINTDYRALGKWPQYLRMAWNDLRSYHDSPYFELHQKKLRSYASDFVSGLPYTVKISSQAARRAGVNRGELEKRVDPFFNLLPGLILNIAFMKIALDGVEQAKKSPFPVTTVARAS
ncbi:MAG TPA: halocarboxylic acid dehydrogenase DehI family protein [Acidobacteriota bacterium]|jgi:hypothetical protein